MSFSIKQLLEISKRLSILGQQKFHPGVSLKLSMNARMVEEALVDFRKQQNDLIAKLGEKQLDENGKETGRMVIHQTSPNWEEYEKTLLDLLMINLEVALQTISITELGEQSIEPYLMEGIFTE